MIYKDFQDLKLSALGMGCMRLPVVGGNDAVVDEAAAEEMVDCAMANGVNYYDTAWGYHNGNSEIALGKALAKHPREKFYIADKFPGYDLSNMPKVQEIFEEQLKKCRVDYFDFYLFHNVCEMNIDAYLDPQYGIHDYLMEQKRRGRIRHLGFSCHGNLPVLKRFLDAYGKDMEFCQLQLNYIDWTFQNGREKVELLDSWHIPVWVMEPLRGGRLARLSDEEAAPLRAMRPEEPIPAWAFRFLQSIPSVTMILSGMSDLEQVKANIATFQMGSPQQQGDGPPAGPGPAHGQQDRPSLHRLPLLRQPLSSGAGYPLPAGAVQRACLHRRRLLGPHGPLCSAAGQVAQRLHRLPQLRGGLSSATEDLRGHGRLCVPAVKSETEAPPPGTLRRGCSLSRSLDGVRECGPDGLRQTGGVQLFPAAPLRKAVDRLFVRRQPGDDGQRHRPFPLQLPDQNAIHTRTVWSEAADAHRRIPVAGHAACPPGAEKRIEVTAVNLCHADNHVEPGLRFSPLILLQCPCGNSQAFRSLFLGKSRQSPLSPKGALFLDVSFFFDIFA